MPDENNEEIGMRFAVAPTYRCNLACPECNRYLNVAPWKDSDVSVEAVKTAGLMVRSKGVKVNKVRLTGGEPTLHPDMVEIVRQVQDVWQPVRCIVVLTNHTVPKPDLSGLNARYSWIVPEQKGMYHRPYTISPADLGIPFTGIGVDRQCNVQRGCGRLFDSFGFSFCVYAGALGRLLGIDTYSAEPTIWGREDVCRHCICSLPRNHQWRLWRRASEGRQPFPTQTFREGLRRLRTNPPEIKKFVER